MLLRLFYGCMGIDRMAPRRNVELDGVSSELTTDGLAHLLAVHSDNQSRFTYEVLPYLQSALLKVNSWVLDPESFPTALRLCHLRQILAGIFSSEPVSVVLDAMYDRVDAPDLCEIIASWTLIFNCARTINGFRMKVEALFDPDLEHHLVLFVSRDQGGRSVPKSGFSSPVPGIRISDLPDGVCADNGVEVEDGLVVV